MKVKTLIDNLIDEGAEITEKVSQLEVYVINPDGRVYVITNIKTENSALYICVDYTKRTP